MYAQVDKTKGNKNNVVANSVNQHKSNYAQRFIFVDDSHISVTRREHYSDKTNVNPTYNEIIKTIQMTPDDSPPAAKRVKLNVSPDTPVYSS
jgi:hypothetical protein